MSCPRSAADKLQLLTQLIRCETTVRPCLNRILSAVVPRHVAIKERETATAPFKALADELDLFLGRHFSKFLAAALEMSYMCGFVVFVIRRHRLQEKEGSFKETPIPVILPIGAFTWAVRPVVGTASGSRRKRRCPQHALYYYDVTPSHPAVRAEDLHVYSHADPGPTAELLPSPLDGLLADYAQLRNFEALARRIDDWNSTKHITTSEKVDAPRDQTTDGISLLDDFRRYIMSGQHTGISSNYMVMSGAEGAAPREDPSNVANSWINDFAFAGDKGNSTCVHLMPPNTAISELGALEFKHDPQQVYSRFQTNVMAFFEMTPFADIGGHNTAVLACELELRGMRRASTDCAALLEHVYAATFDVEPSNVLVALPRPALPESLQGKQPQGKPPPGKPPGKPPGTPPAAPRKSA